MKKLLLAIVLIGIIGFGGYALFQFERPHTTEGATGQDWYNHQNFFASLSIGGRTATSSVVSTTFKAKDLTDVARVDFTPNVAGLTETIPATTTIAQSLVPKAGDTQEVLFCNATTTAATPFTLAFGTGIKNQSATSTYAIATGKCAAVRFSRKSNSDIDALFSNFL